jgi:hypothetical protein
MTPVERQEGIAALLWLSGALGSAEISPEAGS